MLMLGSHGYKAGTPGYDACQRLFTPTFRELLAEHDWSFARRRVELEPNVRGEYELPADIVTLTRVEGLRNWYITGTRIRPKEGAETGKPIVIHYTSDALANSGTLPQQRTALFAKALRYRLAAALAVPIRSDDALRERLSQEAEVYVARAMTEDTQSENSNDQHPLERILETSIFAEDE